MCVLPGHLYDPATSALNSHIHVASNTPPTFIVQAENDPVDTVSNSLIYYSALKNAKVPAELHLYPEGGHAFGLRRTTFPTTNWPPLVETWLHALGMNPQ